MGLSDAARVGLSAAPCLHLDEVNVSVGAAMCPSTVSCALTRCPVLTVGTKNIVLGSPKLLRAESSLRPLHRPLGERALALSEVSEELARPQARTTPPPLG